MSRGDRSEQIPRLVVGGITSAFRRYQRWTLGEKWLGHAPELFVSVEIASHVREGLSNCRVDMEASVREASRNARSNARGRPLNAQRFNGRYDILVSRKNGQPWCAIEVKSPVWSVSSGLVSDIERITSAISHRSRGSSLSCGAVAFYSGFAKPQRKNKTAQDALDALGANAEAAAKRAANEFTDMSFKLHQSKFKPGDEDDGWQAFCLFFQMRKRRKEE